MKNILHHSEIKNGSFVPIMRGWYLRDGVEWENHLWEFVLSYLEKYEFCLSAESSLDFLLEKTPKRVTAMVRKGGGKTIKLPHGYSLLPYEGEWDEGIENEGVMELDHAICRVGKSYFWENMDVALRLIESPGRLIENVQKYKFYQRGKDLIKAYALLDKMEMSRLLAEYLDGECGKMKGFRIQSSSSNLYTCRILAFWERNRDDVLRCFPPPRGGTGKELLFGSYGVESAKLAVEEFSQSREWGKTLKRWMLRWGLEEKMNERERRSEREMEGIFTCLDQEPDPGVRALLGAYLTGDELVLGTLLVAADYPWTCMPKAEGVKEFVEKVAKEMGSELDQGGDFFSI